MQGEVTEIDIDGPNGTGTFDIALKLYTDSTFSTLETKNQFLVSYMNFHASKLKANHPIFTYWKSLQVLKYAFRPPKSILTCLSYKFYNHF